MKRIHTKRPRQERWQKSLAITTVLLGMLFASSAWAGDHHMVVEGLLKDDAGAALNGRAARERATAALRCAAAALLPGCVARPLVAQRGSTGR